MYSPLNKDFGHRSPSPERLKRKTVKRYPAGDPLPKDPAGQKLSELFPNGWDWIYSPGVEEGSRPEWETVKHYPLTPQQLWEYHQDPESLVGTRPKAETRWVVIDIDKNSPYHPLQDSKSLERIQSALELIGICRFMLNQSSFSRGLHLYCPLPDYVSSFWLSVTVKYALETVDVILKSGHCEIFPNPKRYKPRGKGFSNYAAIRLPMQPESGFMPLDEDLAPLPWNLDTWLEQFERLSEFQDQELLNEAIADAKLAFKTRKKREPLSVQTWQEAIALEKAEGWTGPGQTNEKLKSFACEARVFLGLETIDDIADHVYDCSVNSPGFYQFSGHVRDIKKRSMEIAMWAYEYYWPYGSDPQRSTTYKGEEKIVDFQYHQSLKLASQEKIKAGMKRLKESNHLASGISDRANQLIFEAKVSRKTLYKPHNIELWHPKFVSGSDTVNSEKEPLKSPETNAERESLPLQPNTPGNTDLETLESLSNKNCFYLSNNEGFVDPIQRNLATDALPLKGQRAAEVAPPLTNSKNQDVLPKITNWDELRASLPLSFQKKLNLKQQQAFTDKLPKNASGDDSFVLDDPEVTNCSFSLNYREVSSRESDEFEYWFDLAKRFGIVDDYEWHFQEYLVLSQGKWVSYCELSAMYSILKLRKYLGIDSSSQ